MPSPLTANRHSLLSVLVRGILFLVPIVLIVILVRETVRLGSQAMQPVAKLVPAESVFGLAMAQILAIVALAALCFIAGLFAATQFGSMLSAKLESWNA
jgi:uncharacterized membrane protein